MEGAASYDILAQSLKLHEVKSLNSHCLRAHKVQSARAAYSIRVTSFSTN